MAADALSLRGSQGNRAAFASEIACAVQAVICGGNLNCTTCDIQRATGFDALTAGIALRIRCSSCRFCCTFCGALCSCFCSCSRSVFCFCRQESGFCCRGCVITRRFVTLVTFVALVIFIAFIAALSAAKITILSITKATALTTAKAATLSATEHHIVIAAARCNFTIRGDIQRTAVNPAVCFCLNSIAGRCDLQRAPTDGNPAFFVIVTLCRLNPIIASIDGNFSAANGNAVLALNAVISCADLNGSADNL